MSLPPLSENSAYVTPRNPIMAYMWRSILVIANVISLPFAYYLWENLNEGVDVLLDDYDHGKRPDWLPILYIYFGAGVICSTIIDIFNQNLKDFSFSRKTKLTERSRAPGAANALYRTNQILFILNAIVYSMAYATGARILARNKDDEITITSITLFFGTIYYFLFTDKPLEKHACGIFELGDRFQEAKQSPVRALRAAEFCLVQSVYRAVLAANDIIQFWLKMKICKQYSGAAASPVVIFAMILTFYLTHMSRDGAIWSHYVTPPLSIEQKIELQQTPFLGKHSILPLLQCLTESTAIAYLSWTRIHPSAALLAVMYFIYGSYVELNLAREREAKIKFSPVSLGINDAIPLMDNGFDDAVNTILDEHDLTTVKVIVLLGRLTRPEVLFNFISVLMIAFTSYKMGFSLPNDIILAAVGYVGSKIFTSEYCFYKDSFRRVVAERMLTDKMIEAEKAPLGWGPVRRTLYRLVADWKPKEQHDTAQISRALCKLRQD